MENKKANTRFSIQFNRNNLLHLQVVDILNRQDQRGKARYIVEAVLHYENCDAVPDIKQPARLDEKHIEAIVDRMLRERDVSSMGAPTVSAPTKKVVDSQYHQMGRGDEVIFNDALETLGEDGLNAVAGALEMFRKR
jgi:hypothetical protein